MLLASMKDDEKQSMVESSGTSCSIRIIKMADTLEGTEMTYPMMNP